MNEQHNSLPGKIRLLELELLAEIKKKEVQFSYEIRNNKAHFTAAVAERHRRPATSIARDVRDSLFLTC